MERTGKMTSSGLRFSLVRLEDQLGASEPSLQALMRCSNGLRKRRVFSSFVAMRCQDGQSRATLNKFTRIIEDQEINAIN